MTLRNGVDADRAGSASARPSTTCTRSSAGPPSPTTWSASGEYGERFASIVERDNVAGVQFHPEKSSRDGLALLRNFVPVILYPAIDILDGKAVRLVEGRFEDQTVYHDDPLAAAQSWVDAGARFLHVVDLDGARSGEPRSIEHLRRIASETGVPVQYGGGLRSLPAVREALRAGAERVIIGTAAFRDVDFLDTVIDAFGAARARLRRRPRRPHLDRGLDADDADAGRRRDPPPRRPRRLLVRLHRRRPRRQARGAGPRRRPRGRGGGARALPLLRRDRRRSSTCARWRACARSTSPA